MPPPRRPGPDLEPLAAVSLLVARWIERTLGHHRPPLTVAQFLALRAVAREPLTAAELARRAGISGPAASQLVAGLEAAGWLARSPDPADRRRLGLSLTPAGASLLRAAQTSIARGLQTLVGGLPRHHLDHLASALPELERAIAGSPPPRRLPPPRPPAPEGRRGRSR